MRLLFCLASLLLCSLPVHAGDVWARYRGPDGSGISDSTGVPVQWDEKTNVTWKTAIHGKGWSSPVVWGEQIWLTTAPEDGTSRWALCIDRETGKILHDIKLFDTPKPLYVFNVFNSHASPSPVIEQGRVYVHFGCAGTACLDTATGKVLWTRTDLKCEHWRGPGSSPVLYKDLLILTFDGHDLQYTIALEKNTGKTVWRTDRTIDYKVKDGDFKKAYGTPTIIQVGNKPQLISSAAVGTESLDPETGQVLWKVHHGGMNSSTPPLFGHGLVFVTIGTGSKLVAIRPTGSGDVTKSHVEWIYTKAVPNRSGPILIDDLIYMVEDKGFATCLEARTGAVVWTRRLGKNFTASPIYADGHLYFCDQDDGYCHVLSPGREMKVAATNKLDTGSMATPAIAGKSLFIRTRTHLYRIDRK